MSNLSRRVLAGSAAALALSPLASARADERPVRLVVGFPPGSGIDTIARVVAEKMRGALGRPVVVENKPGAAGIVAALAVKAAPPDGTTLLLTPLAQMTYFPIVYAKLDYDPFKDFAPVAHVGDFQMGLGVGAEVPARSLAEYAALAKKGGAYANFSAVSVGSLPHFFGLLFARTAGIDLTFVPYKGAAPVMQALIAGEIPAAVLPIADLGTLVQSGKGRLLATTGATRSARYPDAPTFKESGYDIEGLAWYALFAPAGTPGPILDSLSRAAIDAVRQPDVMQVLAAMDVQATGLGRERLAAIQRADYDKWAPVIRASGFKAD
ncbi:MAG: tripartite tricarboxylate transporter substrate-binding protein [Reyranellaceae bacterium]